MRSARTARALRLLLPGLLLVALQGCGGTRYIYVVDMVITLPTEADDKPGVWFDAERETPARALPRPVRGVHVRLHRLRADPEGSGRPDPVVAHAYSDSYGCVSLVGETELDDGDLFSLVVSRKGYKTMRRRFRPAALRDASLTVVVRKLPGSFDPLNDRKEPEKKATRPKPDASAPSPAPGG